MKKYALLFTYCLMSFFVAVTVFAQQGNGSQFGYRFTGPGSFAPPPGGPGLALPPPGGPGLGPLPPGFQGYQGQYGFTGSVQTVTVEQAKTFAHRTPVIVTGTITRAVGGDFYLFRDSSGEIMLRIGPNEWYALGSTIGPSDNIEISGEVHKDPRDWQRAPEIHARYIRKL